MLPLILIIDVTVDDTTINSLRSLGLTPVFTHVTTSTILSCNIWESLKQKSTLLVFPGNGSQIVKEHIPKRWLSKWKHVTVYAKRFWQPGENPFVYTERIFPKRMLTGITDVVILDDVISSGQTCQKIKSINEPWIANARWHAVSWVKQCNAGLKGFDLICSATTVGTKTRRVPIISLSTLRNDSRIAHSFATRNVSDPNALIELIRNY